MKVFAYKNTEEKVMQSSSGGAFIAICETFEKLYGEEKVVFCGAELQADMVVRHSLVKKSKECKRFQGSKYVRSDITEIYKKIIEQLKEGKWVLFSGTPCQVYALKQMGFKRGVVLDRLLAIDIICHGVPKPRIWNDYKKWLEQKSRSKLIQYNFRYKLEGWKAYPGYAEFQNGTKIINTPETSIYSYLHMAGYSIESGCFSCPFANEKRQGDITLGDYWGIETIVPDLPYKQGVSLILVNTLKGERIISQIEKSSHMQGTYLIQTRGKAYVSEQENLVQATKKPKRYEEFWQDYESMSFDEIIDKYTGYGKWYRVVFGIKKYIRKTPLIEWYRAYKRNRK